MREDIAKAIEAGNKHRNKVQKEKVQTPFGWFDTYENRFDMFNSILNTYMEHNLSGGSLHIYLDEGNKGINNIIWCKRYAQERGDWIGVYLCDELLYYGEKFINNLIDYDIHVAHAFWCDEKRKEETSPL